MEKTMQDGINDQDSPENQEPPGMNAAKVLRRAIRPLIGLIVVFTAIWYMRSARQASNERELREASQQILDMSPEERRAWFEENNVAEEYRILYGMPVSERVAMIKRDMYFALEEGIPFTRWLLLKDLFPDLNENQRAELAAQEFPEFEFHFDPDAMKSE